MVDELELFLIAEPAAEVFWYNPSQTCPESTLLLHAIVEKMGENPLHIVMAVSLV